MMKKVQENQSFKLKSTGSVHFSMLTGDLSEDNKEIGLFHGWDNELYFPLTTPMV